jgi:hypothetical protein
METVNIDVSRCISGWSMGEEMTFGGEIYW